MSNMTQSQRTQYERYDLHEKRDRLRSVSDGGQRLLSVLTLAFIGVLGALTFAAIQIFDGWHHAFIIADLVIFTAAVAVWLNRR